MWPTTEQNSADTMQQEMDVKGAINAGVDMMMTTMKMQDIATDKIYANITIQKVDVIEVTSVGIYTKKMRR